MKLLPREDFRNIHRHLRSHKDHHPIPVYTATHRTLPVDRSPIHQILRLILNDYNRGYEKRIFHH